MATTGFSQAGLQALAQDAYRVNAPQCVGAAMSTLLPEANSLAGELEKRIADLTLSLDGFADAMLGSEPTGLSDACKEAPPQPGELYRLMSRLRAAHAAVSRAETAFGRLRPIL